MIQMEKNSVTLTNTIFLSLGSSSGTYAGDDERCELDHGESVHNPFDLHFSNDGMFFYIANRKLGGGATAKDLNFVARFDLTAPYDISTCSFSDRTTDLASNDNRNGSAAGASGIAENSGSNKLQGVSLSNDGKKMFVIYSYGHLLEFNLSTAFDVTTFSLVTNAGMTYLQI